MSKSSMVFTPGFAVSMLALLIAPCLGCDGRATAGEEVGPAKLLLSMRDLVGGPPEPHSQFVFQSYGARFRRVFDDGSFHYGDAHRPSFRQLTAQDLVALKTALGGFPGAATNFDLDAQSTTRIGNPGATVLTLHAADAGNREVTVAGRAHDQPASWSSAVPSALVRLAELLDANAHSGMPFFPGELQVVARPRSDRPLKSVTTWPLPSVDLARLTPQDPAVITDAQVIRFLVEAALTKGTPYALPVEQEGLTYDVYLRAQMPD